MAAIRRYDRRAALAYARRHWNDPDPRFANMDTFGGGGDCTNFTSQCLLAGNWPLDFRQSTWTTEWWYRRLGTDPFDRRGNDWWSCTWSVPENQFRYLSANHGDALDLLSRPRQARSLRGGDIFGLRLTDAPVEFLTPPNWSRLLPCDRTRLRAAAGS